MADGYSGPQPRRKTPKAPHEQRNSEVRRAELPLVSGCPEGWHTRADICSRTGKSDADMRRLESKGVLRADARNTQGWSMYKEATVRKIVTYFRDSAPLPIHNTKAGAAHYSIAEAKEVFAALKSGKPFTDIVLETSIHPAVLDLIKSDYERLNSYVVLDGLELAKLATYPVDGVFPIRSGEDVIAFAEAAMKRTKCVRCLGEEAQFCRPCLKVKVEAAQESLLADARRNSTEILEAAGAPPLPKQTGYRQADGEGDPAGDG